MTDDEKIVVNNETTEDTQDLILDKVYVKYPYCSIELRKIIVTTWEEK